MTEANPIIANEVLETQDLELAQSITDGNVPSEEIMDIAEAFDVIGIDPESMTPATVALGNAAWAAREKLVGPQPANDDVPALLYV
jgi:hypothetical protein